MTSWTLLRRSFRFYARSHLGVILGAAVGGSALVGALLVGDSMRASLLRKSLDAIGMFEYAMPAGDRLLTTNLAPAFWSKLASGDAGQTPGGVAAILGLPAVVTAQDGNSRANQVSVIGSDSIFLELLAGGRSVPGRGEALVNPALASQLRVNAGDELLVRVPRPGALSHEVTLTERDDVTTTLRLQVGGILPPEHGGDFSLFRSQASPLNLFVDRETLARAAGIPGKANTLLVAGMSGTPEDELAAALKAAWRFADAALELRPITNGTVELRTSRVFLDAPVLQAAREAFAGNAEQPVLTYLANLLRSGTNSTPYSFVTAAGPPHVPEDMRDDEILVSQWLAEDLQIKAGDKLAMSYYLPESGANLQEATNQFTVRAILPAEWPWEDRTLMPDFPGIEKAESTGDWEIGFELVHKIRAKDEDYWKQRRGTPKAFVTLRAGSRMWANRFGELTALRWTAPVLAEGLPELENKVMARLDPARIGLRFEPIRAQAYAGAQQSQDFGQLFIGFSFFLVVAALLLVALLFQFGLEQRATEVGTLLAMGFSPGQVRRLLLGEGAMLAIVGGAVGVAGGAAYAQLMLWGLGTLWRDAVGTSGLHFHAPATTLLIGFAISVVVATCTLFLTLRRLARQPALALLGQEAALGRQPAALRRARLRWLAFATLLAGLSLLGWSAARGDFANPGVFFGAGALLLISGFSGVNLWLAQLGRNRAQKTISLTSLGVRGSARRRKRSLATAALLGCGVFLVVSVSVFRLDAGRDADSPKSGTGGFELIGEATLPVVQDLNTRAGQEFFGLSPEDLREVRFVSMRLRGGDDASCLNLNRAQQPRILGVDPEALAGRFAFAKVTGGLRPEQGWQALRRGSDPSGPTQPDEVPAIGDAASIQWALGKKVGDVIEYRDEAGRTFKLRLVGAVAGSVLQGNLLIDEAEFRQRFPGESGYRVFLVDGPAERVEDVRGRLTRALADAGLELTPTVQRLEQFNAVQNTYLGAFQVLGGLGLLLGSVGLGIVVLRNVMERRGELGLLSAVGFTRGRLQRLVLLEHGALLALGIGIGTGAGLISVLPALLSPGTPLPWVSLGLTLSGVLLNGLAWTWAATRFALRGELLAALRNE